MRLNSLWEKYCIIQKDKTGVSLACIIYNVFLRYDRRILIHARRIRTDRLYPIMCLRCSMDS